MHAIFDVICNVFCDNVQILGGTDTSRNKTQKLMTKMVNSLMAKMELGALMIAMYLLGLPDHYTSHHFAPFYWIAFVNDIEKAWSPDITNSDGEKHNKIMVIKKKNRIISLLTMYDYIF